MKLKVNFEYGDRVIAILLDESLIHINNLTNAFCKKNIYEASDIPEWNSAYDYLENECIKAFIEQTGIDEDSVYIDGFINPTDKDPTGFRVRIINTLS